MFRRTNTPTMGNGAQSSVSNHPARDVGDAIRLLDEVEAWLTDNGAAIAHAARRPWSRDAVGWHQSLHAVHEELVEQSTRLTSQGRESSHTVQEDTHALLARIDRMGTRKLVRDGTVAQLIPWFLPTQLIHDEG